MWVKLKAAIHGHKSIDFLQEAPNNTSQNPPSSLTPPAVAPSLCNSYKQENPLEKAVVSGPTQCPSHLAVPLSFGTQNQRSCLGHPTWKTLEWILQDLGQVHMLYLTNKVSMRPFSVSEDGLKALKYIL